MIIIQPIAITDAVLLSSNVTEADYAAWSATTAYVVGNRVIKTTPDIHKIYEALRGVTSTVTITIASPGVVSWTAHGLADGTQVVFSTTGTLPTGIVAGTVYYVKSPATNSFNIAATSGGTAIVTTGSQSGTHTAGSNLNQDPGTNLTGLTPLWLEVSATNRWKMFDTQNNTQTTNADSITLSFAPVNIATAFYAGNVDCDTVTITVIDATDGTVYTETQNMSVSNSGASFWNWGFRKIIKKTVAVSVLLPPYANATINVTFTKTGSTAKCGQCVLGPWLDIGLSQYGLGTDIKDYSTVLFNSDGTSTTTERQYSKRMTADITIDNVDIDWVQNLLSDYRQTNVVWLGSTDYESTCLFGRYSSFKNIVEYPTKSKMALQIEGAV